VCPLERLDVGALEPRDKVLQPLLVCTRPAVAVREDHERHNLSRNTSSRAYCETITRDEHSSSFATHARAASRTADVA
jgi:hypothetical protein